MTVIKFLSDTSNRNILSSLHLRPDALVLLGCDAEKLKSVQSNLSKVFSSAGIHTEVICRTINIQNLENCTRTLIELHREYNNCIFDISGGDTRGIAAIGAAAEKCRAAVVISDIYTGNLQFLQGDIISHNEPHKMTIAENIKLFGGVISYCTNRDPNSPFLRTTADERRDLLTIWDICRTDPALWNASLKSLKSIVETPAYKQKPLSFSTSIEQSGITEKHITAMHPLMTKLLGAGILTEYSRGGGHLRFAFKNRFVGYVLSKAGTVLELCTYLAAIYRKKDEPQVFDSGDTGVTIDWDGTVYSAYKKSAVYGSRSKNIGYVPDVINEIDVMLMKNNVPFFISCKNGQVTSDELYKLSSVADRFGGRSAKKALVLTSYLPDELFLQRAREMNIAVIRDVHKMEFKEFSQILKNSI